VPLVTCLDNRRVGLDDDIFEDDTPEGHSRDAKDEEDPIDNVGEGKSYPP
jgi:hypothetical protein